MPELAVICQSATSMSKGCEQGSDYLGLSGVFDSIVNFFQYDASRHTDFTLVCQD